MTELEQNLRNASLRSHDRVTATITDLDYHEDPVTGSVKTIHVSYEIGTGDGETIGRTEQFDLPTENTPEYAFVRLCREADVPLPDAATELVGCVVDVTSDDTEWQLQIPEEPAVESDRESDEDNASEDSSRYDPNAAPPIRTQLTQWAATEKPMVTAARIAAILALPVVLPAIAYAVYSETAEESASSALLEATFIIVAGLMLYGTAAWTVLWVVRNLVF